MQRVLFSAAVLAGLLFAGCSTLPGKTGPDDCLVVVKVEAVNNSTATIGRQYSLNFSSDYPPVILPGYSGFVAFIIREPAVKVTSLSSKVLGGFAGPPSDDKLNGFMLPYSPGHIVVCDFVYINRLEGVAGRYVDYTDFRKITESEKTDLLQKLAGGSNGDWKP